MSAGSVSTWLGRGVIIICCLGIALITRPMLHGLAALALDLVLVVALASGVFLALKGWRRVRSLPHQPPQDSRDEAIRPEEKLPVADSKTRPSRAERAGAIEAELEQLKRALGKAGRKSDSEEGGSP